MTDPMELVGRLEKLRDEPSRFVWEVNTLLTEAAACIREMVEHKKRLDQVYAAIDERLPIDHSLRSFL